MDQMAKGPVIIADGKGHRISENGALSTKIDNSRIFETITGLLNRYQEVWFIDEAVNVHRIAAS